MAGEALTPKRGMRFVHTRFLRAIPGVHAADSPHAECEVTRTDRYTVWYRTENGGSWRKSRDTFAEIVLEVLPPKES